MSVCGAEVLTFSAWKEREIYQAKNQRQQVLAKASAQKSNLPRGVIGSQRYFASPVKERTRNDLKEMSLRKQASHNSSLRLEMARSLTVRDYFDNYLASQPDRFHAYEEAARKVSNEEMTYMLLQYNQLQY